jgi:integrase
MARKATGSVRYDEKKGCYVARITVPGGRPWVDLEPSAKSPKAEARAREKAAAITERARERKLTIADFKMRRTAAQPAPTAEGESVEDWCDRWHREREARGLKSVGDDRSRLKTHVFPSIGKLPIRSVTRNDLERLVEKLDDRVRQGEISWKTATHAWSLVSTMFKDCCGSKRLALRAREDDPSHAVRGPDRGDDKAKVYLYPSEFSKLMECADVPLRWRRMFAVTTYLYARAGEVNALTWDDVDLERGVVHIHASVSRTTGKASTTKTGGTRRLPIEATLLPLLQAMHDETGGVGRISPIRATDRKLSRQLQRCLALAGVDRADLVANDASRKPMTFHDLRSTGITWAAVRGDDSLKIKQRAGHATFTTTEGYIREAENLSMANFGEPFPALPASLLRADDDGPEPEDDGDDESEDGDPESSAAIVRENAVAADRAVTIETSASTPVPHAPIDADGKYAKRLQFPAPPQ